MKNLLKKIGSYFVMLTVIFLLSSSIQVSAAENAIEAEISTSDVQVDEKSKEYSFEINVDTEDAYAGAEFGVFCSQGTEITSIKSTAGSVVGPTEANGLVWFSFYAGEDKFTGTQTITVEGTFETEREAAIMISDIKIYTVGDSDYTSTSLEGGIKVNLYSNPDTEVVEDTTEDNDISTIVLLIFLVVIVAVALVVLIYIKRKQANEEEEGERKNGFQKS